MSMRTIYCVVKAGCRKGARGLVSSLLDEMGYYERFFDHYTIDLEKVLPTKDVSVIEVAIMQRDALAELDKLILEIHSPAMASTDRGLLGDKYKRVGRALSEDFSPDMPNFNFEAGDYSFPVEDGYWAVPVSFHY